MPDSDRTALEKAAERIVLTERQLQTFRDQGWAHDLFKDRARTRALLFCGFGSEEPQIRHTALALMEEFSRNGRVDNADDVMGLPNAPFLRGRCSFAEPGKRGGRREGWPAGVPYRHQRWPSFGASVHRPARPGRGVSADGAESGAHTLS